jgi:excisionase family DNA binding protein
VTELLLANNNMKTPLPTESAGQSPERLVTVQEAADLSSVSYETIARYIKDGKITPVRLGPKMIRIRYSELQRFWGQAS